MRKVFLLTANSDRAFAVKRMSVCFDTSSAITGDFIGTSGAMQTASCFDHNNTSNFEEKAYFLYWAARIGSIMVSFFRSRRTLAVRSTEISTAASAMAWVRPKGAAAA